MHSTKVDQFFILKKIANREGNGERGTGKGERGTRVLLTYSARN